MKIKYNWRLKSDEFVERYIGYNYLGTKDFFFEPHEHNAMTELELKKLLEGTGLLFEAFERVEDD